MYFSINLGDSIDSNEFSTIVFSNFSKIHILNFRNRKSLQISNLKKKSVFINFLVSTLVPKRLRFGDDRN